MNQNHGAYTLLQGMYMCVCVCVRACDSSCVCVFIILITRVRTKLNNHKTRQQKFAIITVQSYSDNIFRFIIFDLA